MSTSSRHQPNGRQQERFDLTHGLNPGVGDGLGDRLEQAPLNVHPVGSLDRDEVVLTREAPPDDAGKAQQVDGQDSGQQRGGLRVELVEDHECGDGPEQNGADQREEHRSE